MIEAVEAFVKNLPELPKPAVELPAVDVPAAAEVNAAAFDVAEKALAQHRAAADKLIAVLTPAALNRTTFSRHGRSPGFVPANGRDSFRLQMTSRDVQVLRRDCPERYVFVRIRARRNW